MTIKRRRNNRNIIETLVYREIHKKKNRQTTDNQPSSDFCCDSCRLKNKPLSLLPEDNRFFVGQVGAEDALGLGIEVVGTVA